MIVIAVRLAAREAWQAVGPWQSRFCSTSAPGLGPARRQKRKPDSLFQGNDGYGWIATSATHPRNDEVYFDRSVLSEVEGLAANSV